MSRDKKSVFVSYVRDNSVTVNRICNVLRTNSIDYWLDRDHIEPGKIWKQAIKDAVGRGTFFLACFSKEYENRSETYMNEELLLGVDILRSRPYNSGWLIPAKLSPCHIPPLDIGAGKTLHDLQCLCFYEDWDRETERLIKLIKRVGPRTIYGKWVGPTGLLSLAQHGEDIVGQYQWESKTWNGEIVGKVIGDRIVFRWHLKNAVQEGVGYFDMDEDLLLGAYWFQSEAPTYLSILAEPDKLEHLIVSEGRRWDFRRFKQK
jgi:hypothetical protein